MRIERNVRGTRGCYIQWPEYDGRSQLASLLLWRRADEAAEFDRSVHRDVTPWALFQPILLTLLMALT